MASATAVPENAVHFVLKVDDQAAGEHDASELDPSRAALDRTLARLSAGGGDTELLRDLGYSCEWWPPD
jgi:hypothetical protein